MDPKTKNKTEGLRLLTTREAAERMTERGLKIAEPTLDLHRYRGAIAYVRVGRGPRARVRFTEQDVDEFISARIVRVAQISRKGAVK